MYNTTLIHVKITYICIFSYVYLIFTCIMYILLYLNMKQSH